MTHVSLQTSQRWFPGLSCGTWLSMVVQGVSDPCRPSFGSFHTLLILTVPALYVILTVSIRPYLLTFFIPIWMLLMVFQTSLIHCRLLLLFQTQTRTLIRFSLPHSWTHHQTLTLSLIFLRFLIWYTHCLHSSHVGHSLLLLIDFYFYYFFIFKICLILNFYLLFFR